MGQHLVIKKLLYFSLPIALGICFYLFLPSKSFAINHFFNGNFTELKDIITPNDSYFAGTDSAITTYTVREPTLIITAQEKEGSKFKEAYGGGRSAPGYPNNIKIFSTIIVSNSVASQIVGGSLSQSHTLIDGSVSLSVNNTIPFSELQPLTVYGGCKAAGVGNTQSITGSVFMRITDSTVSKLCGLGDAIGLAPNFIAVKDSILIQLNEGVTNELIIAGEKENVNLGGDAFLFADKAKIGTLWGTKKGNIGGSLNINLMNFCSVDDLNLTEGGKISGPIIINLTDVFVRNLNLGPAASASIITPVTLNIEGLGTTIGNLICGPSSRGGFLNSANITLFSGLVVNLQLGSDVGITNRVNFFMNGGFVSKLTVGSNLQLEPGGPNVVIDATATISDGTIGILATGGSLFSVLNFVGGGTSNILRSTNTIDPNSIPFINFLTIKEGASTVWGEKDSLFRLKVGTFRLEPNTKLFITAEGAKVNFVIGERMNVNGPTIIPQGLKAGSPAPLTLTMEENSQFIIEQPFNIDLSFSPEVMEEKYVPIVTITPPPTGLMGSPTIASSKNSNNKILNKKNRHGLFWFDSEFDQHTTTWYCYNIKYSQDFYGLSAFRKASNWLRKQQVWNIQNRSKNFLSDNVTGLWITTQGGYEKLDTDGIGKSNISWIMASIGYDFLQPLTSHNMVALYGFSFGLAEGYNSWHTVNKTKNTIHAGMLDGYFGLLHDSGVYGTATIQITNARVTMKAPGFDLKHLWTEIIPTEAIELGWKYVFNNGFRINPRGQVIFEQLSKHHINTSCGDDTETLDHTFLTTTSLGLVGEYNFLFFAPINLQSSIEWIKGIYGDFGVKSKVLKRKFKDKNDSSIFRTSVGITSQIKEYFDIRFNVFVDAGDDKGIGGQISSTYKF